MLKKIYEMFGFVVLTKQIFTFPIPFFSTPFMGRDINTYLQYFLMASSLSLWVANMIFSNKVSLRDLGLLVYIVVSAATTVVFSWSFNAVLSDFFLFMMPVVVYAWYSVCKPKLNTYINVMMVASVLSGILSVLISLGIVDVNIWAAEGDLVRAAGAISSTFGVGAFIVSICLLFLSDESWSLTKHIMLYASLIGSIVTVLLSFSRTRWVICACIAAVVYLLSFIKAKKTRFGFARIVVFIALLVIIILTYQPDFIEQMFEQMQTRFEKLQKNDHSITYRFEESKVQLSLFKAYFFLGTGWGALSSNGMYVHNLYASLPAQSGIISIFYFIWLFSFLVNVIKGKKKFNMYVMISLLTQIVLIILNATNGGIVVSGGYYLLIFVFIIDDAIKNNCLGKEGDASLYENRNTNLS